MSRSFSVKKRDSQVKTAKPLLLIIVEGKNVTETQYFRQYQRQRAPFNIKILTPGSATDPEKMLETLERYWKQYDMSHTRGDQGFVVLDLDCNEKKALLIKNWRELLKLPASLYRIRALKFGLFCIIGTLLTYILTVTKSLRISGNIYRIIRRTQM